MAAHAGRHVGHAGAQTLAPAVTLGREIEITATQAQHFSARTPFDRNRALWGGFIITIDEQQIYFAGDSGYVPISRRSAGVFRGSILR